MYLDAKLQDGEIRDIARHTIREEEAMYDLKHIMRNLNNIYFKLTEAQKPTVVETGREMISKVYILSSFK